MFVFVIFKKTEISIPTADAFIHTKVLLFTPKVLLFTKKVLLFTPKVLLFTVKPNCVKNYWSPQAHAGVISVIQKYSILQDTILFYR